MFPAVRAGQPRTEKPYLLVRRLSPFGFLLNMKCPPVRQRGPAGSLPCWARTATLQAKVVGSIVTEVDRPPTISELLTTVIGGKSRFQAAVRLKRGWDREPKSTALTDYPALTCGVRTHAEAAIGLCGIDSGGGRAV